MTRDDPCSLAGLAAGCLHARALRFLVAAPCRFHFCAVLLFLFPQCLEAQDTGDFRSVRLSEGFRWATSGVWHTGPKEESLFIVDTIEDRVFVVSPSTGRVDRLDVGSPDSKFETLPTQIRAIDTGYLLLDDSQPSRILKLDNALRYVESFAVAGTFIDDGIEGSGEDNPVLTAIFDFLPMDSAGAALAFADLEGPGGPDVDSPYYSAFLYFDRYSQQIFERVANDQPERFLYTRNIQYMAVVDDVGYILSFLDDPRTDFIDPPRVVEARLGVEGLQTFSELPEEFREKPDFEGLSSEGPRKATQIYQRVEAVAMAAGLYSWNGRLYLLGKERMEGDSTAWWLVHLSLQDGREIARMRLDTDPATAHMTVVPGARWAFVQKGRVEGIGLLHAPYMETLSTMFVSAAWIETATAD